MTTLYDVVNFNCDASCLDSEAWLAALSGGEGSQLYQWLSLYVELAKPIALGFTGATLADIAAFNPEALRLVRERPEIFQILWRPFAHDLPFFRTEAGFDINVTLGRRVAEHLVGRISPVFLPPEFMQTNRQSALLAHRGAQATMVMATRFNHEVLQALPTARFRLRGIPDGSLTCIPAAGELTKAYLASMQLLDADIWHKAVGRFDDVVMWRDGESPFLIPDGLARERFWLQTANEKRAHLPLDDAAEVNDERLFTYPVHPFSAWMDEMSMLWFIHRVRELEQHVVASRSPRAIARWLNCINSDMLSAVEKRSPIIKLRHIDTGEAESFRIVRSNRGYEGEALLEAAEKGDELRGDSAWQKKASVREKLVCNLLG